MAHLHLRAHRVFGLLSLGVALVACQSPDTTPNSTSAATGASAIVAIPTEAQFIAAPTVEQATAVSPSTSQALITTSPTVTALPTLLPTLTTITFGIAPTLPPPSPPPFVRTADRLPIDQPWLLVDDGSHVCGELAFDQSLIAIDHTGGWTRLNRRVTAFAKRPGLPPLLATCTAKGTVAIVDPVRWTSVQIKVPSGFFITQFVVSPDQKQAMFCHSVYTCLYSAPAFQRGALAPFSSGQPGRDGPFGGIIGWGRNGLYYVFSYSIPRSTTFLFVGDPAHPTNSQLLNQDAPHVLDSAHDRLLQIRYTPLSPLSFSYDLIRSDGMILADLHAGTAQTIEQPAWIAHPTFAPDGMALVYFRALLKNGSDIAPPTHRELVIVDSTQNTKTILTDTLTFPYSFAPIWSLDGQRISIVTQSPDGVRQVAIMTRDGTLLNTVPLSWLKLPGWGITHDDQLLLYWNDGHGLSWVPLRAGAAPYAPDMLMGGLITAVILPPVRGDTSLPPAPTSAVPPPVTQLPTPAPSTLTPLSIQ